MSNKNGFAIAFNWIFSLAAGAIIFIFFIYFAFQHTDLFGQRTNVLVREEFDNAFGGLESTDITTNIELGERITLKFQCWEGDIRFGVESGDKKEIPGKIIAAPEELSGYNFSIQTKSFVKPFKIASFIYIDSDEDKRNEKDDPLEMAKQYSYDKNNFDDDVYNNCILPMLGERLKLVREVYVNKISYISSARDSNGNVCDYTGLKNKIQSLTINNLDSLSTGIISMNEDLVRGGCPALF